MRSRNLGITQNEDQNLDKYIALQLPIIKLERLWFYTTILIITFISPKILMINLTNL